MNWEELFDKGKKNCCWQKGLSDMCSAGTWHCNFSQCMIFYWLRFWRDNVTPKEFLRM